MSTPIARKQSNRNGFTRSLVVLQLSQMYLDNANKIRALNVVIILNDIKICNKYLFIT